MVQGVGSGIYAWLVWAFVWDHAEHDVKSKEGEEGWCFMVVLSSL